MKKILFLLSISTIMLFTNAAPATVKAVETKDAVAAAREPIKIHVYFNAIEVEGAKVENLETHRSAVTDWKGKVDLEVREGDKILVTKGNLIGLKHVTLKDILSGRKDINLDQE